MNEFGVTYGEAAKNAAGFFWKSGWAFVLGYTISAAIQAFVNGFFILLLLGGGAALFVSGVIA